MVLCPLPACNASNNVARSPTPRFVTARKPLMFHVTMRIRWLAMTSDHGSVQVGFCGIAGGVAQQLDHGRTTAAGEI